jgi:dihydroorotate dehydrogenase electron transfer subunit
MKFRRSRLPSNKFVQATIVTHRAAGRGYYRLVLKAPAIAASARPGHFVMLRVTENRDPLLGRPFGIASLPTKSTLELFYRVVGRGTSLLAEQKPGTELNLLGPIGNGFPAPLRNEIPILVAGGSGFPPLHFFSLKSGAKAYAFIGARDKACLPPESVLKRLRASVQKVHIATEDGSAGTRGFVTEGLNAFFGSEEGPSRYVLYACGPHAMLAAVSHVAAARGIKCYVSMEARMACGVGACMGCSVHAVGGGYKRVCKEGPVFDSREIDWSEIVPVSNSFNLRLATETRKSREKI